MNGEAECPTDLEMTAPKNQDRWSQEDMLTLLECMKNNLPSNDGSKFKTTESHLDWEKVAFKDFSGEMCKMKWMEISNEVRKFRTLTELIMDAEEHVKNPYKGKKLKKHPDFPKKPLTPYFRFFMEKRAKYAKLHPEMSNLDLTKILSKKYKELPEKKKMKYIQDFQREKQEFERNLARFREDHPDLIQNAKKSDVPEKPKTPQQLWYNHEKKIYLKVRPDATTKEVKESLGKQWSQLSDKKRLKWIHKALEQRKEYEEIMRDYIQKHPELNLSEEGITRSTLTKAERQLKDKFDGRPTKPPPNSYSLYCAELMANMKDVPSTERMVLCSQQWKLLSQKEKDAYHKKCDQKKKDYEIELLRFLESLPEEEQQRVLGEEKMLGSNRKGATSPASKKSSPETGKASSEKPKRPISAMFIFSEEKRKQLQEERPELSESELTRLLARMWNDLSEKKKAKYKAREAALKAQSEKKHGSDREERGKLPESPKTAEEIWQQSVIGDYLARFKNDRGKALKAMEATWNNMEKKEKLMWIKKAAEDQKRYERELSEMRAPPCSTNSAKKMKFQGEPKKPPMNGYQKFSQELLSNGELNHLPLKERMVEIGSRWQRISQGQKDHYKKLAEEQQKQYKVHLDIWLKSLSPQERAAYKEHTSNKRKSMGKMRGPNPKMKPTMQSKSESEDDDDEEEEEEDDDDGTASEGSEGSEEGAPAPLPPRALNGECRGGAGGRGGPPPGRRSPEPHRLPKACSPGESACPNLDGAFGQPDRAVSPALAGAEPSVPLSPGRPGAQAADGAPFSCTATKKEKAADPVEWTVRDVVDYFTEAGFPEQATAFQEQEIDGKSLLLMQRADVLTGLSIRLGPALKIYEYHVKLLQRSHFEEDEGPEAFLG